MLAANAVRLGSAPIVFDTSTTGAGAYYNGLDFSVSFAAASGAAVIAEFCWGRGANVVPGTPTYNGVSMTSMGSTGVSNIGIHRWYLPNAGTGSAQTLAFTAAGSGYYIGYAYSVLNLKSVGSAQTNSGNGTALSVDVTASGGLIISTFYQQYIVAGLPSYSSVSGGTLIREYQQGITGKAHVRQANGSSGNLTFSATSNRSTYWAAMANVLT